MAYSAYGIEYEDHPQPLPPTNLFYEMYPSELKSLKTRPGDQTLWEIKMHASFWRRK